MTTFDPRTTDDNDYKFWLRKGALPSAPVWTVPFSGGWITRREAAKYLAKTHGLSERTVIGRLRKINDRSFYDENGYVEIGKNKRGVPLYVTAKSRATERLARDISRRVFA